MATNEYVGNGKEKAEFHSVVAWDRLADICASYLGKGMTVAIEDRIQTRQWDDDRGAHHWKTEIVAIGVLYAWGGCADNQRFSKGAVRLAGRRQRSWAASAVFLRSRGPQSLTGCPQGTRVLVTDGTGRAEPSAPESDRDEPMGGG